MSAPMTEDEMVRALMRQVAGVSATRARELVRDALRRAGEQPCAHVVNRIEIEQPFGISVGAGRPTLRVARWTDGQPEMIVERYSSGVLRLFTRPADCSICGIVLATAPRTKKGHTTLGIVQSAAYRRYRDDIVDAIAPVAFVYGKPLLPDRHYNCAAVFYVDKRGERADYNGLNQGLHDALENAGVVSDDWYFRTCDGTRIVFGDELPRVEVTITPITTGT